jgi:tetratricopeptide (TPR) repeat protein
MSEEWVISLYTVAASAYANIHNISKAQEILEECRDKYPDNRTIRYVLGQLYMSLHKYKDAYLELSIFLDNKIKIEGLPISIDLMRENIQTGLLISSLSVGDFNVADTILKTLTNDINYKIRRPNELFKFKED